MSAPRASFAYERIAPSVQDGTLHALDDGYRVDVRCDVFRIPSEDCWRAHVFVGDMVGPLRKHTLQVDGYAAKIGGPQAFAAAVGDLWTLVRAERALRQWSACDL